MKSYMIKGLVLFFASSLLLTGCFLQRKASSKKYNLTITNPSAVERVDELIVLSRQMIEQTTGKLKEGRYVGIANQGSEPVVVQYDDMNKDGIWDEAAFLYSFQPNETVQLNLSQTTSRVDKAVTRAHVRMRKKNADNTFGPLLDSVTVPRGTPPTDFTKQKLPPYLTEGPAWENDKVAFRIYMDTRNTKDIFGKTTNKMMMDTVGVLPENVYHDKADWGMDILAVGKSLGAGSLALNLSINGKDSLVRLGGTNIEQTTFEKIADGPVRAIFRMHYKNWLVSNDLPPVNVVEEISIWGGKYYYQSKVTVINAPPNAKLVTGIVNLKSKKSNQLDLQDCKVLYTYDVQSENKDNLGLAVLVPTKNFTAFGTTPNSASDVLNTYTATMPLTSQPSEFRFVLGWERSDLLFTKEDSFRKFLETEAIKYGKAVIINLK